MILDEIVAWKKTEVAQRKLDSDLDAIKADARAARPRPFEESLIRPGKLSILSEIKRASPSAGVIRRGADPEALARSMEAAGAQALSVLTDSRFFQGSLDDMEAARRAVSLPVLEKDFVIDAFQVYEAAACGADAVLLIVRILDDKSLADFHSLARELGMGCLVEVHSKEDLERALAVEPRLLGINNRDLSTFTVDIENTLALLGDVPDSVAVVSQSGIATPQQAARLHQAGVSAIQVGESLMRANDPGEKIRELLSLIE